MLQLYQRLFISFLRFYIFLAICTHFPPVSSSLWMLLLFSFISACVILQHLLATTVLSLVQVFYMCIALLFTYLDKNAVILTARSHTHTDRQSATHIFPCPDLYSLHFYESGSVQCTQMMRKKWLELSVLCSRCSCVHFSHLLSMLIANNS